VALKRFRPPDPPDDALVAEIRDEIAGLPGVGDLRVEPGERDVAVETDEAMLSDDEILAAIGRTGVEASLL